MKMIRFLALLAVLMLISPAILRADPLVVLDLKPDTGLAATPIPPLEIPPPTLPLPFLKIAPPKLSPVQAQQQAPHLPGESGAVPALSDARAEAAKTSEVVRIALILTLMAVLPAILLCMTSFVRIIVVLSMIRHGLSMPETPPNQVLVSLAIFLTMFSMFPTVQAVNDQALQPFLNGQITISQAIDSGTGPARDFMLRQVRDQDIKAVYDIARKPLPDRAADVGLMQLVPAFMLNELRVSFRIGFVIMLPFLLIDLVVSSILLSLGMLMVPPSTLSLPIKVLMFVLIDGWSLVLQGVLGSFR